MSILFVGTTQSEIGGSTSSFTTGNVPRSEYDSPYDTNYVSECVGSQLEENIPSGTFVINTDEPTGDYWLRFRVQWGNSFNETNIDGHWIDFYDSTDTRVARIDAVNGTYAAQAHGDSIVTGTYGFSPIDYTVYFFDIKISVGADIVIEMYLNGVLASSATAANTGGKGSPTKANFDHDDMFASSPQNYGWLMYSEFIIMDGESTIGHRLAELEPDTAGANSDLSGAIADLIDANDGAALAGDADGEKSTWTLTAYNGPATPASVRAVCTLLKADAGLSGPQNLQHVLRIGTTDYNSPNQTPSPTGAFHVWDNNPATNVAWDTADFASMEQGVEIKT